ncbi:hypothetical protein QFZ51_004644 [Chitinophaga sp. W3I9]|uniref:hypothetical protein n=1 Tax=Chitinophaga sp. W3I9 TaxID=3373924 RepID=UPI003D1D1466
MAKLKKLFPIFCMLIVALSCDESKLSKGPVASLSLIRAEINITQRLHSKIENQVVVILSDEEGKTIKNDSIKIYVNGAEVKYTVRQGLYYTSSTYYLKDSANPKNNQFNFEIALPDGKKSFLAEVDALDLVNGQNISYTEKGNLNKDYEITWKELTGVNYLAIARTLKVKNRRSPILLPMRSICRIRSAFILRGVMWYLSQLLIVQRTRSTYSRSDLLLKKLEK